MKKRNITFEQIEAVLRFPDVVYPGKTPLAKVATKRLADGSTLKIVFEETPVEIRVISAMWKGESP